MYLIKCFNMLMLRGVLEILEMADGADPKSFSNFTKISINKKRLSSATVSKRLNELVAAGVMVEVIHKSATGRKIIAYKTTDKGRKVIEHAKEIEKALSS